MNWFVELLEEIRSHLNKNGKEYPELTYSNYLNDLHFASPYNYITLKLQSCGSVASSMFGHIKGFEKRN